MVEAARGTGEDGRPMGRNTGPPDSRARFRERIDGMVVSRLGGPPRCSMIIERPLPGTAVALLRPIDRIRGCVVTFLCDEAALPNLERRLEQPEVQCHRPPRRPGSRERRVRCVGAYERCRSPVRELSLSPRSGRGGSSGARRASRPARVRTTQTRRQEA